MTGIVNRFYSGTPLIWSPMGQTNLAVLTGDRIDEGFLQENVWLFCQAVRRGFTVFKCTLMIFMVFMIDVTFFNFNKALTLKRNALYGITLYCV